MTFGTTYVYLHLPIRIQSVELEYPLKEGEIKRIYSYILRLSSHCTVNNIRLGCENQLILKVKISFFFLKSI
jgi:hypothetical protein